MKKIFITTILASVILTGCSDAYDIHQAGTVTRESDVFRTPEDIGKGIRFVYSMFPGETEISFTSYFTDELGVGIGNAGQGVNDGSYTFLMQAGNGSAQTLWGGYYGIVNRLNRMENRIIEMEEAVTTDSNEAKTLKRHKAHIYALRAYCHYKLFAYFTPDYTDPNGLSVIKFHDLQTDDYNRFEKRATVSEIVAFIEDDIRKVRELGMFPGEGSGYASMPFVESILIKLYSMVQTPDAYAKLEEAFNRLTTPPPVDPDDPDAIFIPEKYLDFFSYQTLFSATPIDDGGEAIFRLIRTSTDGGSTSGAASAWYADRVGGQTYMEMGRSLYNELDKLDPDNQGQVYGFRGDLRYNTTVHSSSKVAPNYASLSIEDYYALDVLHIGKYGGDNAIPNRPLMGHVWVFRYTDMLLALAEKRAFEGSLTGNIAIGDYSNVESIIYNIRAHRNESGEPVAMPTDFSSAQACYARILEERRVEFAFEGHRYLDMKRLGVKAGSPGFVRDPQDCFTTGACQLEPTSTRLTLPIPRSEMISNPNMVQNPGY